tara:strand:- start:497 stop:1063 length:567 start_codon:yes stop_codon:yes gene_type:complete
MDMPEDVKQPVSTDETSAPVGTDETSSAVTQDEINVPKARLDEVLSKNKALQKKISEIEAKQEKAREEQLAKNGEVQTLYDEAKAKIQTLTQDNERLRLIEQAERDSLLSQIPEDKREKYAESKYDNEILRDLVSEFSKAPAPKMVNDQPGAGRMNDLTDSIIDNMDDQEKRSRWSDIVNYYRNKPSS